MTLLDLIRAEQTMTYPDRDLGKPITAEGNSEGAAKGWETRKGHHAFRAVTDFNKLPLTEQLTFSQMATKGIVNPDETTKESLGTLQHMGLVAETKSGWNLTRDGENLRKGMTHFKNELRKPSPGEKSKYPVGR